MWLIIKEWQKQRIIESWAGPKYTIKSAKGNTIYTDWIVNTFLSNFYKDNPKRYATGVW